MMDEARNEAQQEGERDDPRRTDFWPLSQRDLVAMQDDVALLHALAMHGEADHLDATSSVVTGAGMSTPRVNPRISWDRGYTRWLDGLPEVRRRCHVAYLVHELCGCAGAVGPPLVLGWRVASIPYEGALHDAVHMMWRAAGVLRLFGRSPGNALAMDLDVLARLRDVDKTLVDAVRAAALDELRMFVKKLRVIDLGLTSRASVNAASLRWQIFTSQHRIVRRAQLEEGTDEQVINRFVAHAGAMLGDDRRVQISAAARSSLGEGLPPALVELACLQNVFDGRSLDDFATLERAVDAARRLKLAPYADILVEARVVHADVRKRRTLAAELFVTLGRADVDRASAAWLRGHAAEVLPPPLLL